MLQLVSKYLLSYTNLTQKRTMQCEISLTRKDKHEYNSYRELQAKVW